MDKDLNLEHLKQKMSERLAADAELLGSADIPKGDLGRLLCTADVGCDHGYISMYLVMRGISERAIAMDVRKGPLSAASGNVAEFGLEDNIELRLSDGLSELKPGEADSVVIAGMGGKLMMSILDRADVAGLGIRIGVLQPQSDIMLFRLYLRQKGYLITDERIVFEEGKYYFPMLVDFAPVSDNCNEKVRELADRIRSSSPEGQDPFETAIRLSDRYGIFNIHRRDKLLTSYLLHGREVDKSILSGLDKNEHRDRYLEVDTELRDIEVLLQIGGNYAEDHY